MKGDPPMNIQFGTGSISSPNGGGLIGLLIGGGVGGLVSPIGFHWVCVVSTLPLFSPPQLQLILTTFSDESALLVAPQ